MANVNASTLYSKTRLSVCPSIKLEWSEVGGANIETMDSKDVIGVHLLLQEQVKAMINAINTDRRRGGGVKGEHAEPVPVVQA